MLRATATVLLTCLLLPVLAAAADDPLADIRQALAHRGEEAAAKARLAKRWVTERPALTPEQDAYDVHHYDLALELDPVNEVLSGTVTTAATVTAPSLDRVVLDLDRGMLVSACRVDGLPAAFSRAADLLTVDLPAPRPAGAAVSVSVDYQGDPAGSYFGWSSRNGHPMIWTLSEPFGAREWWPCKDVNTDKADSVDVRVTVPSYLIVASNGLLISDVTDGASRSFHWRTRYAMATYLVSLAVHPFSEFSTWYAPLGGGDPMEIQHYVFADQFAEAQTAYAVTDEMMTVFAQAFGEYPFIAEKYGHASFPWAGGMEHQTMTSMGGLWHDVISHELGHQWWGDMITCADFGHIWLNEGFATWCEAYYREMTQGRAVYDQYMDWAAYYGPGTIFVEDTTDFWGIFDSNLSYNKASWVVHMLRGVLGDADFFAGLAAYRAQYGFGSATTEQFRDVMEAVSGKDLHAFFQQWIYGAYYPIYKATWSQAGSLLSLTMEQTQAQGGLFTMPVPVRIVTDQGVVDVTLDIAAASQEFRIHVDGAVQSIVVDPDGWILCRVDAAVEAATFSQGLLLVNAVNWSTGGAELTACFRDSVFSGREPFTFWDVYSEPAGGYASELPAPLGHGAVPWDILQDFSAVVWVGGGDVNDRTAWFTTLVPEYLDVGGNVLLMAHELDAYLFGGAAARLDVSFLVRDALLAGALQATAPELTGLPTAAAQDAMNGFVIDGPATEPLYAGLLDGTAYDVAACYMAPAGGERRPDGGRFAVLGGHPHRWERTALRANVQSLLSVRFGEPYTAATRVTDAGPPLRPRLGANYPNPFNPQTVLPLALARAQTVDLAVYDVAGRRVRTLLSGPLAAGDHEVRWDGRDDAARELPSGTYFARLRTRAGPEIRPLTLVR